MHLKVISEIGLLFLIALAVLMRTYRRHSFEYKAVAYALIAGSILLAESVLFVSCASGQSPYRARYAPVTPAYRQPASYQSGTVAREFVILEALDTIFDLNAKDIFVWTEPPRVVTTAPVGVRGDGTEARLPLYSAVPARERPVPAGTGKGGHESAVNKDVLKEALAEEPAPRGAEEVKLASLKISCASCHTTDVKVRGGFRLFKKDGSFEEPVDWALVSGRINDASDPMPPADAKAPPVSPVDKKDVAILAKKK